MNGEQINKIFDIKEPHELPTKLMKILMDEDKKNALCLEFLKSEIDLSKDVLRDYFQTYHANRSDLKQDYTPDCLCELLQLIAPKPKRLLDECSGTGALTISFLNNNDKQTFYQLEELSSSSIPILLLNLSIRNVNAIVRQSDVLQQEVLHTYKLTSGEQFSTIEEISDIEVNKFDVVISNPPYSLKWESPTLAHFDERFQGYSIPPKQYADYAFVLDIISKLEDNGKAFIILPHGCLFREKTEGEIRRQLIKNNLIDTIIGLPPKLFLNTSIPVFILVINKNKKTDDILFINAEEQFKKENKNNVMEEEHIKKILYAYELRTNIERFSKLVNLDEIKNNDYNLNINRYVSLWVPEPLPDLNKTITEIIKIKEEIRETEKTLANMFKELEGATPKEDEYYKQNIAPLLKIFEGE